MLAPRLAVRAESSRLVDRAEPAGWHAHFAMEGDAEVLDMRKTGALGNLLQRKIAVGQQLLHAIELYAEDFLMRRPAKKFLEMTFEECARVWNFLEDIFHVDSVAGVLADEPHGAGHIPVFNREHVRGLAGGDAQWRDEMSLARGGFAAH